VYTFFCTRFIFLPPFPKPSPSLWCQPSSLGRACFALLFSDFVGEKREKIRWKSWHFSLFEIKVAIQGVSLWYFHIYVYYNPNWFISSNFLHATLVPFLW
jgi:hypothetical protein